MNNRVRAFTLLELMIVITLIAILMTLIFPAGQHVQSAMEKARCMSNMRSLHVSLSSYISDKGQWPQAPPNLTGEPYQQWWLDALAPYGAPPRVWQCPTLVREMEEQDLKDRPVMHYTPTPFDEGAFTPFKWSKQPWLIEIAGMHPGGSLIIFPDGSIRGFDEIYAEATGKKVQ